ncbi:unnamed protein product [Sphagnum balticum]
MAEVALVPVPALSHTLKFITGLDLTLIMRVRTVVGQSALAMDEFLTNSIGGELVVVGEGGGSVVVVGIIVVGVEITAGELLIGVTWVHRL